MKKSISEKLGKAKLDTEDRILPKGKDVRLSVPAPSKKLEWILEEMKNMVIPNPGIKERFPEQCTVR
jgi:hypothetical protein